MAKIKKVESVTDRKNRLEAEQQFQKYREFFRDPESNTFEIGRKLSLLSKDIRKKRVREVAMESMIPIFNNMVGKVQTPKCVTLLTEMSKEFHEAKKYANVVRTDKVTAKIKTYKKGLSEKMDKFEIELRLMFDTAETTLDILNYNFGESKSFSESINIASNANIITKVETNILRTFNNLRNLFAHNITTSVFMELIRSEELMLYKALIIETRDVMMEITKRNPHRFTFYESVMIIENGEKNKQHLLNNFDELVEEVNSMDTLIGVSLLASKDYITVSNEL